MRLTQFVQLRRIDVHVDHFGVWREGIELTGHAIVKARADGDQQIALLHRQVCRLWYHASPACRDSRDNQHPPHPALSACRWPASWSPPGIRAKPVTACAMPTPPPTYSIGCLRLRQHLTRLFHLPPAEMPSIASTVEKWGSRSPSAT